MSKTTNSYSVILTGATGAVGTQCLNTLLGLSQINKITTLGRRPVPNITSEIVQQHQINILEPDSYRHLIAGHQIAICTLGVGQPSKVSREDFIKIDKTAVIDFAKACKESGIRHFELLSSVGISTNSRSFYLRSKAELVEALKELRFERLSIFQPSMILTPTNRYGLVQAITLVVWPWINPLLIGGLKKYRGIKVEQLGAAMASNILETKDGFEYLEREDFVQLAKARTTSGW